MIIVLAKAIPKDENAKNQIIDFSKDLIENSKSEEGNIDYNLYTDTSDNSLMFVEKWESKEALEIAQRFDIQNIIQQWKQMIES